MQNLHDSDIAVNMEVSDQNCKSYNSIYVMKNTKVMKIRYLKYIFSFSFTLAIHSGLPERCHPQDTPIRPPGEGGKGVRNFHFPWITVYFKTFFSIHSFFMRINTEILRIRQHYTDNVELNKSYRFFARSP